MTDIIKLTLTHEQVEDIITGLIIAQAAMLVADGKVDETNTRPIALANKLREIVQEGEGKGDMVDYDHVNATHISTKLSNILELTVEHLFRKIAVRFT